MRPQQVAQGALLYEFDLAGVRAHLSAFHRFTGRPSIDPEQMIRMLIATDANTLTSAAKEAWDLDAINRETAPRAVVEQLLALDDAAFGAATEVTPKGVSHADPSKQWTAAHHGPACFA